MGGAKGKLHHQSRQAELNFLVGKAHADAIARTQAKGNKGVGHQKMLILRQEPLRIEDFRFWVVGGIVMNRKERHLYEDALIKLNFT